ncbi:hypothetical protein GCM10027034_37630 [Ramlibacter solisilvae]|uniref:alpha/beta fold hydrolase n=1 Tax=Ramlibacter tataouinensis TaxID=94132 RepID=UPI0011AE40EE|nr:alpha/beta hydrolase [Ramlibacter tataouinensis]
MESTFFEAVTLSGRIRVEACGPTHAPALLIAVIGTSRGFGPGPSLAYREALGQKYRLVFWDYPPGPFGGERAGDAPPMTPSRVVDDYIAVADIAGIQKFAYFGYSFGGNSGLQLAMRHPDRLTALAIGGWPAMEGGFGAMLAGSRGLYESSVDSEKYPEFAAALPTDPVQRQRIVNQYLNFVEYYEVLQDFDDAAQRSLAMSLKMPRLNFADALDVVGTLGPGAEIGPRLIRNEAELRSMGWATRVLHVAKDSATAHFVAMDAGVVAPLLDEFLTQVL